MERYQVIPGTTRLGPMHWPGSDHRSGTSTCAVPVQFCSKTQLYSSRLSAHLTTLPPPSSNPNIQVKSRDQSFMWTGSFQPCLPCSKS